MARFVAPLGGLSFTRASWPVVWRGFAQLSEAFTASLSDLTKNTFHHIKLYLFPEVWLLWGLLLVFAQQVT